MNAWSLCIEFAKETVNTRTPRAIAGPTTLVFAFDAPRLHGQQAIDSGPGCLKVFLHMRKLTIAMNADPASLFSGFQKQGVVAASRVANVGACRIKDGRR